MKTQGQERTRAVNGSLDHVTRGSNPCLPASSAEILFASPIASERAALAADVIRVPDQASRPQAPRIG